MKNNNLIRFLQSLVFLPVMTMALPLGNVHNHNTGINSGFSQNILVQQLNINSFRTLALNQAVDPEVEIRKAKANAIDAYFAEHDMPLEGMGMKMVLEAEKNGLNWRLLPAISVIETTGGKSMCKNSKYPNNPWGWGSCKIGFNSIEESIEIVAMNLGGNNPKTKHHYSGKTVEDILKAYNPPKIVPNYAKKVMRVMDDIGDVDIVVVTPDLTT